MQMQFTTSPLFGDARLPARFWRKVRILNNGCWEWTAALQKGYGVIGLGTRRDGDISAHRWAYLTLIGPIPEGLECDHLCRNRACVNPLHIEPVTRQENLRRGIGGFKVGGGNQHSVKTHCPQGHDYDYVNSRGWRKCRRCERAGKRRRRRSRLEDKQ